MAIITDKNDLSPELQRQFAHLEGDEVVVRTYYANPDQPGTAVVYTHLPSDDECAVWADAAFTNGGPLVKIEMVWAPDEAAKLRKIDDGKDPETSDQ